MDNTVENLMAVRDQEQRKLDALLAEVETIEGRIASLDSTIKIFNSPIDEMSVRQEAMPPKEPAKTRSRLTSTATRKKFRDWVVKESSHEGGFSRNYAADMLDMSGSAAKDVIDWALTKKPPLIEETDIKRRDPGVNHGKWPTIYRYVSNVPEVKTSPKQTPPERTVRMSGSVNGKPIAGTGKRKMKIDGEIYKVIKPAIDAGADVALTGGDHYRISMDGKQPIIISQTPSDHRTPENIRRDLKRHHYPIS